MRDTHFRRLLLVGLTLAVGVTASPAAANAASCAPGAPGLGDRLFPLLGNGGYDVQDYELRLTYPEKDPAHSVSGDVRIAAVATQKLSRFNLDFAGGNPASIDVDGKPANFSRVGEELVITPRVALNKGRGFTVTVKGFTAVPETPDPAAPDGFTATPDGTALLGQPAAAHRLFPSNDHPADKATYTITTDVPEGWTGTASGVPTVTRTGGGRVVSTYRQAQPMATELLQVAAGDFVVRERQQVGRVRVRDVVPRRLAAQTLPMFDSEREQIAWMEQQVGPYPFDTYGSLLIDVQLGTALETQTLSVYDSTVLAAPTPVVESVMAHELAHQWYGNSVAPATWSDVWLNESHATWYELLWAEKIGAVAEHTGSPSREAFFQRVYANSDSWRAQFGPVARPKSAEQLFDLFNINVYYGGALALYALEQQLGEPKFQQLERAWASAYRGKSASTDDFIALASRTAGRDLKPFLTAWLYGTETPPMPGHPDWVTMQNPAPMTGQHLSR
ncbi:M1 family metallopeptidase [Micromonospora sp. NPDC050397]|uniref:M1 family metallopeptidase n=1 Tax=Micromonospora sp. NPDC050397 TaxID=3364279 RepID=UPI00384D057B